MGVQLIADDRPMSVIFYLLVLSHCFITVWSRKPNQQKAKHLSTENVLRVFDSFKDMDLLPMNPSFPLSGS